MQEPLNLANLPTPLQINFRKYRVLTRTFSVKGNKVIFRESRYCIYSHSKAKK